MRKIILGALLLLSIAAQKADAQQNPQWEELPALPNAQGFAGMYAGLSHGALICMGGANFPTQPPWEGGAKKWYDDIFILEKGKKWVRAAQKLATPAGYGATVSYQNRLILVGGSNAQAHLRRVVGYEWRHGNLETFSYPDLPLPLAHMAGTLMEDVLIVAGGSRAPGGLPLKKCFVLDLQNPSTGWQEIEPWPGPERIFPTCAVFEGKFYLFGGETTALNLRGEKYRFILSDAYALRLQRRGGEWVADWQRLAPMPRGASAAGTVLPVLPGDRFLFWGGVDAVTALHPDPATHPGITDGLLYYHPKSDIWTHGGRQTSLPARVTLPVVFWNGRWVYVSGEIRPGVRTPSVVGVE